jgi:gliding motility-associated-like protein
MVIAINLCAVAKLNGQCSDTSPSGDCDNDGIINGLDFDADNDGIVDFLECQDFLSESFQSNNGISVTFVFPPATTGLIIDIYSLDNSFNINLNGDDLVLDQLQFQFTASAPTDSDIVFASDGTRYGQSGNPNVWTINGGPDDPIIRLKISGDGQILMLGKRNTNSALEEIIIDAGDPGLNNLVWNTASSNSITINQEVVGPTNIDGEIFGLDCENDFDGDGTPDYLDFDSDDDDCPDALEGDADLTMDDLLSDTSIDDGVDDCGVPLSLAPQGQGVGTSLDSDVVNDVCVSVDIEPISPTCIGNDDGSVVITVNNGSGSYEYVLEPIGITQASNVFENLPAGDYTITITDLVTNYMASFEFTIEQALIECLSCEVLSNDYDCQTTSGGSIMVSPIGGIPQYFYSLNGAAPQFQNLFENLEEGIYTIEVFDGSGMTTTCLDTLDLIPLPITDLDADICFGDSIVIGNSVYYESGMFSDTLLSFFGCDSIIDLDLNVLDLNQFEQSISLCEGEIFEVGANSYTIAGMYADTLIANNGCDSIVITDLAFRDIPEFEQDISLCAGDSFDIGINSYTQTGIYQDTLLGSNGCDSIVITDLEFIEAINFEQDISLCEGNAFEVGNNSYTETGIYRDTLQANNGCDSIVITDLEFLESIDFEQDVSLCEGNSLEVGNNSYTETGFYIDTLLSLLGCDSIVFTDLIIWDNAERQQEVSFCMGEFVQVGSNIYDVTGMYIDTLQTSQGCDSIVFTDLEVYEHSEFMQSLMLCIGDSLIVGSSVYTDTGDFIDTLLNSQGCDSIIFSTLLFEDEIEVQQEIQLCEGDSLEVAGNFYTSSGMYIDTINSLMGCDSIIFTDLEFLEHSEFFQFFELCPGESISVGNNVYDISGDYIDIFLNAAGCDSTVFTELLIKENFVVFQDLELCHTDSLTVGNNIYLESGTYVDTLTASNGCDSLINTTLTILDKIEIQENYLICEGDSVIHEMGTFHEPGIYTFTIDDETCEYDLIINIELDSEENCLFLNCKAYIPNIFSPNNDGINDEFKAFSSDIAFNELSIFDRWGNNIHYIQEIDPSWDGRFNGTELNPSVFVYILRGTCQNGEDVMYSGDVTLVR